MSRLPEALRAHLLEPRHVGPPPGGPDLAGEARNAACRDHLRLFLATADGAVTAAGFRATGCPAALGIASAVTELLPGLALGSELPARLRERFVAAYGEPAPLHRHALALATEALAALGPAAG